MRVRPVFIESKEPTQIIGWKGKLEYADDTQSQLMDKYYRLILVSLDPNDKIDRKYYSNELNTVFDAYRESLIDIANNSKNSFRIIAEQDQIPTELISILINRHNLICMHDFDIEAKITTFLDVVTFNKGTADEHIDHTDIDVLVPKLTAGCITVVDNNFVSGIDTGSGDDKSTKSVIGPGNKLIHSLTTEEIIAYSYWLRTTDFNVEDHRPEECLQQWLNER